MKSLTVTSAHHNSSGEFVDNQNFAVGYDIITVTLHHIVRLERLLNMVIQLGVFYVRKV